MVGGWFSDWFGLVVLDWWFSNWFGLVVFGLVWIGGVRIGLDWWFRIGLDCFGLVWIVLDWFGLVVFGFVWIGGLGLDWIGFGLVLDWFWIGLVVKSWFSNLPSKMANPAPKNGNSPDWAWDMEKTTTWVHLALDF